MHSFLCSAPFLATFLIFSYPISLSDAYDPLDPNGNITIMWDVIAWTTEGYQVSVSIFNYQQYRHIEPPGWRLGWQWEQDEIIWDMAGAEAEMQGDCSHIHDRKPHNCERRPTVVDLFPGQTSSSFDPTDPVGMVANCCKGGVLPSWGQDPAHAVASFQMSVGLAGASNRTVSCPTNFAFQGPTLGYSCSPPLKAPPSLFPATDGRRRTQAMLTWKVPCTYSQFLALSEPSCCVSLSSFYSDNIIPCQTCACACQGNNESCVESAPQKILSTRTDVMAPIPPVLQCTQDMCPIRIHWHVKQNYISYWKVKVTVINRNYAQNYSQWNIVLQHPNFSNLSEVYSFNYKTLTPYSTPNNGVAMFWGIPYYNDWLIQAGEEGYVQSEMLFWKDPETFTFRDGWAFPQRVYFNGHVCVMPPADAYPRLPNRGLQMQAGAHLLLCVLVVMASLLLLSLDSC